MTELPDYTPAGIARAAISEAERLGHPASMMVSTTSLAELAKSYLTLHEALTFYADPATYGSDGNYAVIDNDAGNRARAALAGEPNSQEQRP